MNGAARDVMFSPTRVAAMVLRYWYLLRSSFARLIELIYWPTVQMLMWGFLQTYLAGQSNNLARAGGVFIGAVMLWDILFRGQLGFSISFLEEMYARNLGNLMISPLRPSEFVVALMIMSIVRLAIGMLPVTLLAIWFFGFNLWSLGLALAFCGSAIAQTALAAPAEMISKFRLGHGQGRVTLDPTLNRIAQAQAAAMASKDVLDHDVLAPFNSRVASAGSGRAAENIAFGYDSFAKTLDQWIESPGHRKNLLMREASRVGIAHAESARTHRTYWAMVIAGGYERPASPTAKRKPGASQVCRIKMLGLCL